MAKPKPRRVSTTKKSRVTRRVTPVAARNRWQKILDSFKPANLKAYWLSRKGAVMAAKIVGVGFLLLFLLVLFVAKDLPSPNKINATVSAQTTRFYDSSGNTVLYEVHGDVNRTVINFSDMPASIKDATVAIEDKDFYHHGAFSSLSILRAAFDDLFHRGQGLQGGSTITQQYVKNALLSNQQTFTRKIKELILSVEIEQLYKKDDILKLYLNEIPYGTQAYGIQAASKTYFGKNAQDLTLPESTLLAAIPNAPSYYSPYGDHVPDLIARQHRILDLMAQQHYITQAQADAAKQVDILAEIPKVPQAYANITAPFFVKYVEAQLDDQLGNEEVDSGGLKVITTLNLSDQSMAETAVANNMTGVKKFGGSNAGLVAEDPKTGDVEAWVGGSNFSQSEVDVANALRQPGSSFKPFVYSTLFANKTGTTYGPGSTLYDVKTDFGDGYTPKNYCNCNYGVVSIRQALGNSLNIPAVKALYLAGISNSIKTAQSLGITTLSSDPNQYGLSLVLGSGEVKLSEMVGAYSGFATSGNHVPQVTVLKVTDSKGKTLIDNTKPPTPKQVLDPQVVFELNSILTDPNARALSFGVHYAPLIVPGKTAAVKTGTTENYRDAWTVGYTQSIVAGVWAGNNDGSDMTAEAADVSAPIWHDFMVAATKNEPNQPFAQPAGIKTVAIDGVTGRAVTSATKQTRTDIFSSWYNVPAASDSKTAQVDKVSGLLATSCTPQTAIETVNSNNMQAEVPTTDPSFARWNAPVQVLAQQLGYTGSAIPTASDNVHSCSDVQPTISSFKVQGGGPYTISGSWTSGTFPVNQVQFTDNDQVISTSQENGAGSYPSFSYTPSTTGDHVFKMIVTDSGLYQATQTFDTNYSGGSYSNISPAAGSTRNTGNIIFSWEPLAGASAYKLIINGAAVATTAITSQVTAISAPGPYSWHVDAYQGTTLLTSTNSTSFTAQ